jgi:hypothetical protein
MPLSGTSLKDLNRRSSHAQVAVPRRDATAGRVRVSSNVALAGTMLADPTAIHVGATVVVGAHRVVVMPTAVVGVLAIADAAKVCAENLTLLQKANAKKR